MALSPAGESCLQMCRRPNIGPIALQQAWYQMETVLVGSPLNLTLLASALFTKELEANWIIIILQTGTPSSLEKPQ